MSAGSGSPYTASSHNNKWSKKKIPLIKETEVEEEEATRGRAESDFADEKKKRRFAFDWMRDGDTRRKRRHTAGIALICFFANMFFCFGCVCVFSPHSRLLKCTN